MKNIKVKELNKLNRKLEILAIEYCNILVINNMTDYIDWLSDCEMEQVDLKQLKEVSDLLNKQGYVFKLESGEFGDSEMAIKELLSYSDFVKYDNIQDFFNYLKCNGLMIEYSDYLFMEYIKKEVGSDNKPFVYDWVNQELIKGE